MRKTFLCALLFLITVSKISAQRAPAGEEILLYNDMKASIKPRLMEAAKLTEPKADSAFYIYWIYMSPKNLVESDKTLSEDEKKVKLDKFNREMDKKYKAIPLTDEELNAVKTYFASMRKNWGR
jgi:hypothetical protein